MSDQELIAIMTEIEARRKEIREQMRRINQIELFAFAATGVALVAMSLAWRFR